MRDRRHIVISGPSGSGKSTIVKLLVASNPIFSFSISHTTRPKRIGELEGVDYFFVDKSVFLAKIENSEFLEYALYNGHFYGTSTKQLENQRKILILDLEKQGVEYLMNVKYDFRYIFIGCEKTQLLNRLLWRYEVDDLETLREISNRIDEYDADVEVMNKGIYDLVVDNESLVRSLAMIEDFLYKSEKLSKTEETWEFQDVFNGGKM